MKRLARWLVNALGAVCIVVVCLALVAVAIKHDLLNVFDTKTETHDSQVVNAVQRTQQVSLVGLNIQGIKDQERQQEFLGHTVPHSQRTVYIPYAFTARLGLDGSQVTITESGEHAFRLEIPTFVFIGYDQPTFGRPIEETGVLSFLTGDVDKVQLVNEILGASSREKYLTMNRQVLEDQTKVFYDSLIIGIDPAATTTYSFDS